VALTTILGYLFAIPLPPAIGLDPKWGVAGLTASAGIAGWIEFAFLRRSLNKRIGKTGLPLIYVVKLWLAAAAGAGVGWAIKLGVGAHHPLIIAILVLLPYGLIYFAVTAALKVSELNSVLGRVFKIAGRRR
jgi:putative peptidoglycan lipid II flippase